MVSGFPRRILDRIPSDVSREYIYMRAEPKSVPTPTL